MRAQLGFEPGYTTEEAFADFRALLPPTGGRTDRVLAAVESQLVGPQMLGGGSRG